MGTLGTSRIDSDEEFPGSHAPSATNCPGVVNGYDGPFFAHHCLGPYQKIALIHSGPTSFLVQGIATLSFFCAYLSHDASDCVRRLAREGI